MPKNSRRTFLQSVAGAAAGGFFTQPEAQASRRQSEPTSRPHCERLFELGIVTYNIAAQWDLPTVLRVCRNVGIASVELRTTHRHGVEPSLSAEQRREVRQRFADAGVIPWGCGTACEFHSPNPAVVQRNIDTCRDFIQLTADIGGRGVKVRPNTLPDPRSAAPTLAQIGRALRTCGQAASNAGVEIWVEVHGRGTAEPRHMRTIMEECNHGSVGITWNSNPTDLQNGSIIPAFELLRPWIWSVHIHDLYDNYPYRELFRLLRAMRYNRHTLAEIPGTPDVASGERLLRFYKALWEEMA